MAKLREGRKYVGSAGRATEILFEWEVGKDAPDFQGTVAMYFLECSGQSVAWRHYHLGIIHLRPIPGVKPAIINREGATHEILLAALHPDHNPVADNAETWQYLLPLNFVGQITLPSDDKAAEVLRVLAKGVADGYLWAEPPLSGQKEPWESQLRLLEEHAAGKHVH